MVLLGTLSRRLVWESKVKLRPRNGARLASALRSSTTPEARMRSRELPPAARARLRRVSESRPRLAATVRYSACLGVTSRVTVLAILALGWFSAKF